MVYWFTGTKFQICKREKLLLAFFVAQRAHPIGQFACRLLPHPKSIN